MCKILILLLLWLSDHPDLNWGALLAWKWPRNKRHTSQRSSTKQKMRNTACWVFSSSGVSLCSNFGFSIRHYPVYVNLPFSSPIFWFIWPITLYIQLIIHIFLVPLGLEPHSCHSGPLSWAPMIHPVLSGSLDLPFLARLCKPTSTPNAGVTEQENRDRKN